jgi:hypothetical protein
MSPIILDLNVTDIMERCNLWWIKEAWIIMNVFVKREWDNSVNWNRWMEEVATCKFPWHTIINETKWEKNRTQLAWRCMAQWPANEWKFIANGLQNYNSLKQIKILKKKKKKYSKFII